MAVTNKLTALRPQRATGPAVLHDGGGLYLRVAATGTKSWVFRYQLHGKRRDMGLGSFPTLSLADARVKAAAARLQRQNGIDPLDAREADRARARSEAAKGRTFRQVAVEFIARNEGIWRNTKHRQQWKNTLATYVYPVFGDLPVGLIDTELVIEALDPIWQKKPETASRVRGRIEAILDAAKVSGYRNGPNPAQWRGNLSLAFPPISKIRPVKHHAAMPFGQIPAFMADLRHRDGMAARALELAILTAARTDEVLGAPWAEMNLAERIWIIPAVRMKARREHRVPLCNAAVSLLKEVSPLALLRDGNVAPNAPVFPGLRRALPLSNMAFLMLLRRMGLGGVTAHGFRSSFRDWAAECTGFPREVVEAALAHAVADKTEAAYLRSDFFARRRELMDAWGEFCASSQTGTVVPLRTTGR